MRRIFFFLILLFLGLQLNAQISFTYVTAKKLVYNKGDKIELDIRIKTRPETCLKGMNRVKTYVSGLKIEELSNWKELAKGIWQAKITLSVTDNKKKSAKLTVMRRVDKEDLFRQEIFSVQ